MGVPPPLALRPGRAEDSRACFGIFRASLRDFMRRIGYSTAPDDAERMWPHYVPLFDHLAASAAQWWIAEDAGGSAVGYARSTLRAGTLELTEFFVHPQARVAGAGRALLERAFAPELGEHRSIIATLDAPAVALYLRFGVAHQDTMVGMAGAPGAAEPGPGLDVEAADLGLVAELEAEILGHARPEDLAFIASTRPGIVVRRGGRPIGYAFHTDDLGRVGPVAARDPADLPALLALVERTAHEAGLESLDFTVPLAAGPAVRWLLEERRFRLDPFYSLVLADGPWARLDRYLPFNPCLIL